MKYLVLPFVLFFGSAQAGAHVDANPVESSNPKPTQQRGLHKGVVDGAIAQEERGIGKQEPLEKAQENKTVTPKRVRDGLVAEYRFDEAGGTKVFDRSGLIPALDLVVENANAVSWISGGLSIHSPTILNTPGPARRLTEAIRKSREVSVEVWIRPANLTQDGTARIVGVSDGATMRNFTLGQGLWKGRPSDTFNMRLRTTETDLDGMPMLTTEEGAATGAIQHVVYTRAKDGASRLFVDGKMTAETNTPGTMGNWDSSHFLAVANEVGATRPWLGEIFHIAIFDRALNEAQIEQNRSVGSGSSELGHLSVTPLANTSVIAIKGEGIVHFDRGWVLGNIGSRPLKWQVSEGSEWLSIQPTEGSLTTNGQENLALAFDEAAIEKLPLGTHKAVVQFTNVDDRLGNCERTVILQVNAPGTAEGVNSKPGPHNTGPSDPTILETVGSITVTKPGTIVENVRIEGMLIIRADNVTVRNFIIDGKGSRYGIRCSFGNKDILIEDGEIYDVISSCVYGGGFTARRLNLHESGGDATKTSSGSVIEACWMHHLGTALNAHADGNQTREGKNFVFRGNFFDMPIDIGAPYKSNACLIIQTGLGPIDNVVIENNWLTGGNFTLYITDKGSGYGPPTNVRVTGNRFGREYRYGVLDSFGYVHLENNRWDDTGELMTINNQ